MSDVLASAGSGPVPNVPTVPVRVAGVTAVAQLDTGFADVRVPHSENVNAAFFDAIRAKSPDSIVRDAALRCGGIGTWTAPAAQVATSFYVDAGLLVFDPFAERVWITAR